MRAPTSRQEPTALQAGLISGTRMIALSYLADGTTARATADEIRMERKMAVKRRSNHIRRGQPLS
jgi:hypothetical protein